jgi:hypothetical protein
MRKARQRFKRDGGVIYNSVKTFFEFTETYPNIFRLLFHERSGTTRALRNAVSREIKYFIVELTDYILTLDYDKESAYTQAEAMVAVIFNAGAESIASKPSQRKELELRAIQQLRYIAAGAKEIHQAK